MARARFARRGFSRRVHQFEWVRFGIPTLTIAGAGIKASPVGIAQTPSPDQAVLEGLWTTLVVSSDQSAAVELQALAWGWTLVSDDAFGIGITAFPGPISDDDVRWVQHGAIYQSSASVTAVVNMGVTYHAGSKLLQRSGQTLALVYETPAGSDGLTVVGFLTALYRTRGT